MLEGGHKGKGDGKKGQKGRGDGQHNLTGAVNAVRQFFAILEPRVLQHDEKLRHTGPRLCLFTPKHLATYSVTLMTSAST